MLLVGLLLYVLVVFAIGGAFLFVSAGDIEHLFFWIYLLEMAIPALIATIIVYRHDPDQIREQIRRGASTRGSEDKVTVPLLLAATLVHWVIAGLDVGRFHWSDSIPFGLQVISLIGFGCGFGLVAWSTIVNQFYSPSVRVQDDRGQQVITTGPYSVVRHPGYVGWILFCLFSGMALGSWIGALIPLLPALAVLRRTIIEDQMLHTSLGGYSEYAQKVRYRLIPGVW